MSLVTRDVTRAPAAGSDTLPPHVYLLSLALALVGAVATAATFFIPDVLTGPPVTNGNARGTALVMLAAAIPLLLLAMWLERRGSWRAPLVWLGALFYLVYNAFLLLFLTPFNSLFLLYVATQSLAVFATLALVLALDLDQIVGRMGRIPRRGLAVFVWAIVVLNTIAWLGVVVPAVFSDDPTSFLDGLGVATNAIYVQDLVVWLPLMALAGWWMWSGRALGVFLTGSWLVFGVLESIGIAVDQWFGHTADPTSPHASTEIIPMLMVLALVNLIGVYFYMRSPRQELTAPDV
jgi:hypothetical protein